MVLQLADYVLLVIIAIFTWIGFWSGFIHALGSLAGVFLGAAVAARYYSLLAPAWDWLAFGSQRTVEIIIFIVLFIFISRLVGLVFWLLNKFFHLLKFFPGLGSLNRLLGAVLGFLEGVLVLATVLYFLTKYSLGLNFIDKLMVSQIGQILLTMVNIIKPILPEVFKNLPVFGV